MYRYNKTTPTFIDYCNYKYLLTNQPKFGKGREGKGRSKNISAYEKTQTPYFTPSIHFSHNFPFPSFCDVAQDWR
jgi:hypothetical protein